MTNTEKDFEVLFHFEFPRKELEGNRYGSEESARQVKYSNHPLNAQIKGQKGGATWFAGKIKIFNTPWVSMRIEGQDTSDRRLQFMGDNMILASYVLRQ